MNILFYGSNIDECLESAERELDVDKKSLSYKIVKKSGIFKKKMAIEVKIDPNFGRTNKINEEDKEIIEKVNEDLNEEIIDMVEKVECGIKVFDGKIEVIDNSPEMKEFTIKSCNDIELYINDEKCVSGTVYNVSKADEIRCVEKIIEPKRKLNLKVSKDRMNVYGDVKYINEYIYRLADRDITEHMVLGVEKIEGKAAEKYKLEDVDAELKELNIKHGILYEEIFKMCESREGEKIIIAKGEAPKDDEPDEIKIYFDVKEKVVLGDESETGKIDYKNIRAISNVEAGEVIAEKILGEVGKNGIDVFGNEIKRKIIRNKPIRAGKGCRIEDGRVIALETGRPTVQGGIFTINRTYTVDNVNMKSGNINFIGDIEVKGSIEQGMKVTCNGSLLVGKYIAGAEAKARGNIDVSGSIVNSLVIAGGYDVEKKKYLESLNDFSSELEALLVSLAKILEKASNKSVGELVKILVEQRYRGIPKAALTILTYNLTLGIKNSELLDFIRNKVIGANTFNINSIEELYAFESIVKDEIEYLGQECELPVDINAGYIQNSTIVCTGDMIITGPGSYISSISSFNKIEFTAPNAFVRGGCLKASKCLKLKSVGTEVGTITELHVSEEGIIEAEVIHSGTILYFGNKRKMIIESGRKMKAYMDENKQIQVEMLKFN